MLRSKKFVATVLGIVSVVLVQLVGIAPDQAKVVTEIIGAIIGTFNVGQGIADAVSKGATSSVSLPRG